MRLIDADALKSIKNIQSANYNSIETIQEWIDNAPTVVEFHEPITSVVVRGEEFAKVVRCKDCKRWESDGGAIMWCSILDIPTNENDFCSCGTKEDTIKYGHWIKENIVLTSNPPQYQWHCSECGKIVYGFDDNVCTEYCSDCGSKMF